MTFAAGLPNEQFIRLRQAEDLGMLDLWRWHDSPPIVQWRGRARLSQDRVTPLTINVDSERPEEVLELMNAAARKGYRRIVGRSGDIRLDVAKYELGHAEDWALQADVPAPTLDEFANSLRISSIVVKPSEGSVCFEIWLKETTTDVFTGHEILAKFDKTGTLIGAGLS